MRRIARKPYRRRRYTGVKSTVDTPRCNSWRSKLQSIFYGAYWQVNYQAASLQIKIQRLFRCKNFRKYAVGATAVLILILVVVQLAYPNDKTLPFAHIDGLAIGGMTKDAAAKKSNQAYNDHTLNAAMNNSDKPTVSIKLRDIAASVDNSQRIKQYDYHWYLRLVPTSLFWHGLNYGAPPAPKFASHTDAAINEKIVAHCQVTPTNATLKVKGAQLEVQKSQLGGKCDEAKIKQSVRNIKPKLQQPTTVNVNKIDIKPAVSDDKAKLLAQKLTKHLTNGVQIKAKDKTIAVDAQTVYSWLDFVAKDKELVAILNTERTSKWLDDKVSKIVAVAPGVSKITTHDFTVVSKQTGSSGQALDLPAMLQKLQGAVDGGSLQLSAATKAVPPREEYTRTYSSSDAGLSALMENFAKDHPGTYGVSMIELDGKKRRAEYNGDKQFVTASTYKLLVAYSVLKRIDSGARSWDSDQTCFNKMISLSDNACAESFLHAIGVNALTSEANSIGLKNSTFMKGGGPYTTANDQVLLLGMIATGQNFSSTNQQRLIEAMKKNVYRKGIPAGVSGTVADKVGFMNGLLHDSAIVYSPHGTYVLSIMTEGSSWPVIADLAKQIDNLRAQ